MSTKPMIIDADSSYADRALAGGQFEQTQIATRQPTQMTGGSAYAEFVSAAIDLPPRNLPAILAEAKRVGQLLGESAFYSFPAGGSKIEGATIDLSDALATVWGRCVTRVAIISEQGNRVHLRGVFVDLQALTVVERDFMAHLSPAPAGFASKPEQADRWRTMQLQAASSRAVRGATLHGLPAWLVDAALNAAMEVVRGGVLKDRDGKPIALDTAKTNAATMMERHGLTLSEVEATIGSVFDLWAIAEILALRKLDAQIRSGETTAARIRLQLAENERKAERRTTGTAALGLEQRSAPTPAHSPTPAPAPSAAPESSTSDDMDGAP